MYNEEQINLIILSSFGELTYNIKKLLLSDLNSPDPDFAKYEKSLIKTLSDGVYNRVKGLFYDREYRGQILDGLDKKGVKCVTFFSREYPERLKNISDPPIVLYCKGDTGLLRGNCFAVVGSRKSSPKICADCRKIASELSVHFNVVTGIAEGADTAALEGALENGKAISVIANGFDQIYPASNAKMYRRVEEEGLLVSEYTPATRAKPYYFPVRNRIIAGLSSGTLVVSAGEKSGALITADYAADYGRDVFAFPYSLGNSSGVGCNRLIKNGAYLVENILDILQVYGLDFKPSETPLTYGERLVLEAISCEGEAFLPVIAQKLGKLPYQILPVLSSLEIKKLIVRLGGNRYAATQK